MQQCTTAAALPQPPALVSDAMLVAHRARRIAEREGVPPAAVQEAARSAYLADNFNALHALRAAQTAALGIAILTGRA
jgi:hypothetical protein